MRLGKNMKPLRAICALPAMAAAVLLSGTAGAQTFGTTGTTQVSVNVSAEAAISVTGSTSLATSGTNFANPFTGTTSFTYKIRTSKSAGSGNIQLKVTSDFSGTGLSGPSVASPPTAGDALTYTCAVASSGTACTGNQTASTTSQTSVATFGANTHSAAAGDSGSVTWSLTNDPKYETGSYTATITFTISSL